MTNDDDKFCIEFAKELYKELQNELENLAAILECEVEEDVFDCAVAIRDSANKLSTAYRFYASHYYVIKSKLNDRPCNEYFVVTDKITSDDLRASIRAHWHIDINDNTSGVTLIELTMEEYYLWKDLLALKRILQACQYELSTINEGQDVLIKDANESIRKICDQLQVKTDDLVNHYFI